MWSVAPTYTGVSIGLGATFGFQFPQGFSGTSEGVGYFLLGNEPRNFQAITSPTITNSGRSAYWSVSGSAYTAWVGEEGSDRAHFNRDPNANAAFTPNQDWAAQPCWASPAISSDPEFPAVFGGSAHTEFVRLSYGFVDEIVRPTDSHIFAQAVIDPEDRAVYYAESNGVIHQANFHNIQDEWTYPLNGSMEGEIALGPKGDVLYVGDVQGLVTAIQVAEIL